MKTLQTFLIRTYGCQMNELDSDLMKGLLLKKGLKPALNEESADLVIFNTCSIRDLAERKVLGKIGLMLRSKKRQKIIGITGCMPMLKKEKLLKKIPEIDFILGPNNTFQLIQVLEEVMHQKRTNPFPAPVSKLDEQSDLFFDYQKAERASKIKAYVSIIRGCNNFCSYCVVPYTRGREVSRSLESIIDECKTLQDQGYQEITLLGQNVNSYNSQGLDFADLLAEIDKLGFPRVRFMTSHPKDISYKLMQAIRDLPSVCENLHLPFQSGSSRILKKMNRSYTQESYLEKVELLKATVPNITLGTDIIVGFPTETEEDFLETLKVFEKVRFLNAFVYAYSPRKGTSAYQLKDNVSKEIKSLRLQKTLSLFQKIQTEDNLKSLRQEKGQEQVVEVLVERETKEKGFLKGRTRDLKKVIFPGDKKLAGTLQKIRLEKFKHQTFLGQLIHNK